MARARTSRTLQVADGPIAIIAVAHVSILALVLGLLADDALQRLDERLLVLAPVRLDEHLVSRLRAHPLRRRRATLNLLMSPLLALLPLFPLARGCARVVGLQIDRLGRLCLRRATSGLDALRLRPRGGLGAGASTTS